MRDSSRYETHHRRGPGRPWPPRRVREEAAAGRRADRRRRRPTAAAVTPIRRRRRTRVDEALPVPPEPLAEDVDREPVARRPEPRLAVQAGVLPARQRRLDDAGRAVGDRERRRAEEIPDVGESPSKGTATSAARPSTTWRSASGGRVAVKTYLVVARHIARPRPHGQLRQGVPVRSGSHRRRVGEEPTRRTS